jgi:hypothetical protein
VLETHISWLFLLGDRAYKLKKPVHLDFLDFSTREARAGACRREVELNRRLAPDVYLGVADVYGSDGQPCDHLVVMRRMPDDRRLSVLVERGEDIDDDVRGIARLLAAFHARAESSPDISATATAAAVRARWESSFATMSRFRGTLLDEEVARRVEDQVRRYLAGRGPLFAERIASAKIRDGHGDLLADDIYCLDDGPRVLDCIEFDDTLRYGDVVSDVAFLAMDLERLGAGALASRFLGWYREFADEHAPDTLVEHYLAYRAHVRAKVACLRFEQGDDASGPAAADLLRLCAAHAEQTRVVLTLVGGLPGTGKSTLAGTVADRLGWSVLRSDEVRKDIAGIGHATRSGAGYREGIYSPEATRRTYGELLRRAGSLLERGESVLLDASWTDAAARDAAASVAEDTSAELCQLRCVAPASVTARRIERRTFAANDPSDATVDVARRIGADAPPWDAATSIDTTVPEHESLDAALRALRVDVKRVP